jgi:hypothetical protein
LRDIFVCAALAEGVCLSHVRQGARCRFEEPPAAFRMSRLRPADLADRRHGDASRWFHERVRRNGGRLRKSTIVALARKLLVALWKYVTAGVVIDGAVVRAA